MAENDKAPLSDCKGVTRELISRYETRGEADRSSQTGVSTGVTSRSQMIQSVVAVLGPSGPHARIGDETTRFARRSESASQNGLLLRIQRRIWGVDDPLTAHCVWQMKNCEFVDRTCISQLFGVAEGAIPILESTYKQT